ncbi:MAG: filamentous hemagglutinin N-terminal domain-containing protein [Verrucomicrobia bacterium]|nr:filamentous hemagglutinin N-terminal domain-containing protein [Verrucomicrobiota bacterium]
MERTVIALLFPLVLFAAPHEPKSVHGSLKVSHPDQNTTVISVSDKAIVEYGHFSVLEGEKVQINHPSPKSISLHRDIGRHPSSVLGELSSNGKIFLVNPNGIIFGPHSKVNVGSLIASTLDIKNSDFISGKYRFFLGEKRGKIWNQGEITSQGDVTFISTMVRNEGVIHAPQGRFDMVAGEIVTVDFNGDGKLSFAVEGKLKSFVLEQLGKVTAQQMMIQVAAADSIIRSVVNMDGFIEGRGIIQKEGVVHIASSAELEAGTFAIDAPYAEMEGTLRTKGDIDFAGALLLGANISAETGDIWFKGPVRLINHTKVNASKGNIDFYKTLDADMPSRNLHLRAPEGHITFHRSIGKNKPLHTLAMMSKTLHVGDLQAHRAYALVSERIDFTGHHYQAYEQQWIAPIFAMGDVVFAGGGGPVHFNQGQIHLSGNMTVDTPGGAFSFSSLMGGGSVKIVSGPAMLGEIKDIHTLFVEAEKIYLRGDIKAAGPVHLDSEVSIFQEGSFAIRTDEGIWCFARTGSLGTKKAPLNLQTASDIQIGGKSIFVRIPSQERLSFFPGYRPNKVTLNSIEIYNWEKPRPAAEDDFTTSLAPDLKVNTPPKAPQTSHVHRRSTPLYYSHKAPVAQAEERPHKNGLAPSQDDENR